MSEIKKMNDLETEQIAGGMTDEDRQKIHKFSEELLERRGRNCRKCGKRYLVPDAILPDAYGDFSMCYECNTKEGLNLEGRKQKMEKTFGNSENA